MSRRRIIYSIVVVLLGGAAIALLNVRKADGPAEIQQRLANVGPKLRSVGSARVTFNAEIKPQVAGPSATLRGTSMIKFGATEDWDTTYSSIMPNGKAPIEAHGVRVGQDMYFNSPKIAPADGRPWFSARTPAAWGSPLADPTLGLTDFTVWDGFLTNTAEQNAFNAVTDKLPDVKGADHEHRVRCTPKIDVGCPPPFGSSLDAVFDLVTAYPLISAWIDDDGLVRKLEVSISVMYQGDGTISGAVGHPFGEYFAKMTFTLDRFGAPVTVTAPPDDQVTQSPTVTLKY